MSQRGQGLPPLGPRPLTTPGRGWWGGGAPKAAMEATALGQDPKVCIERPPGSAEGHALRLNTEPGTGWAHAGQPLGRTGLEMSQLQAAEMGASRNPRDTDRGVPAPGLRHRAKHASTRPPDRLTCLTTFEGRESPSSSVLSDSVRLHREKNRHAGDGKREDRQNQEV